ncbi:MAG: type II toxin-antitoxin system RelE/ParE family toxin [Patescibacteria group bacterium]
MEWEVKMFTTQNGKVPVEEFIQKQEAKTQANISRLISLLKKYGIRLGMPHSKRLNNMISELRIRGKNEIRIIYGYRYQRIYILHIFKKKTDKTPQKEIAIALNRYNYCH